MTKRKSDEMIGFVECVTDAKGSIIFTVFILNADTFTDFVLEPTGNIIDDVRSMFNALPNKDVSFEYCLFNHSSLVS
jgi:hypothetical protein